MLAPLLVLVFAVWLGWLPAGGLGDGSLRYVVLPVIALALPQVAYIARLTRGSMIEVLRSPFIRTARAQGLPTRTVILRHALKPALLPVVSYLGPALAAIITGSVVVEQIFGVPGLGRFFVQGALNRDYTLVMGVVVFYGIADHRAEFSRRPGLRLARPAVAPRMSAGADIVAPRAAACGPMPGVVLRRNRAAMTALCCYWRA